MDKGLLRILDANLNRSREGLRVCEDILRFTANDKRRTAACKRIRHAITRTAQLLPVSYRSLLLTRESQHDVGNDSVIHAHNKISVADLLISNMKRAQESLRVLEECSKLTSKKASRGFQALRFKTYQLEKTILRTTREK